MDSYNHLCIMRVFPPSLEAFSVWKIFMSSLHLQVNLRKKSSHCTSIFSGLSDAMKFLYSSG